MLQPTMIHFALLLLLTVIPEIWGLGVKDRVNYIHKSDCMNILIYVLLLILTLFTFWFLKRFKMTFLHESGMSIIYGLIFGLIASHFNPGNRIELNVKPWQNYTFDEHSIVPDVLILKMDYDNKTHKYGYILQETARDFPLKQYKKVMTFSPEIFFNLILPPIIFHTGYFMNLRSFFKYIFPSMLFAFIGTMISAFTIGSVIFVILYIFPYVVLTFTDCLYFGAMISATDPVSVLAIFSDLGISEKLFAIVLGESVLNDVVSIVLTDNVEEYMFHSAKNETILELKPAVACVMNFLYIMIVSFLIGIGTGTLTALLTKLSRIRKFDLLEACTFILMSYSSFLLAECFGLTGIIAVLFCGMFQAQYTKHNLSGKGKLRLEYFFEILNFLSENFIFSYVGVTVTYQKLEWNVFFIVVAFIAITAGRAMNIYPLSMVLNSCCKQNIPFSNQHVIFFAGLRGAVAFALAVRNKSSCQGKLFLSTTSAIVVITTLFYGATTGKLVKILGISNTDESSEYDETRFAEDSSKHFNEGVSTISINDYPPETDTSQLIETSSIWHLDLWARMDQYFLKPLLTHHSPSLYDTSPRYLKPFARIFTSKKQLDLNDDRRISEDTFFSSDRPPNLE